MEALLFLRVIVRGLGIFLDIYNFVNDNPICIITIWATLKSEHIEDSELTLKILSQNLSIAQFYPGN